MAKLDTLKGHNVQIGDIIRYCGRINPGTILRTVTGIQGDRYFASLGETKFEHCVNDDKWELVSRKSDTPKSDKPSGGPSKYYDFPFYDWVTVNDMIEYLSEKQWGKYSWIFKDIVKACTRWGSKDGTTYEYDAKKIIYYGARLLMSVTNKATLRAYLQELLDDKQFQEK